MQEAMCITREGEAVTLERVRAQGRVVGRMLDMTLEQHFRNTEATNVEIVYTFPLPWKAVLLGLVVELNGETLTGVVKARSQARADYEEAVSEGDTGVLLSVNANGTHTLELGNLMAGEACVVRLHYVEVLQPTQGSLRLMLPTTLAPRFGDPVQDGGYEPHAVPSVSASVEHRFALTLSIQGEITQARIGSPSHKVSIRTLPMVGMREAHLTEVQLTGDAWLDRDFVLTFDDLAHDSLGLAAWDRLDPGLGVLMASFTPRLPERMSKSVAMKVLVDCSGSMGGDSITAARRALQGILSGLRPEDRFSLSRFGSSVEHRGKAMWKCAPASMAAARRWAETLEADLGGTEMNDAIVSTLSLPGPERADILLITDGEIEAVDEVVEQAKNSQHRFFVVGIGSSSAEGLLRQLAAQTGGSCEFVAPGEGVEPAILRLYGRMRSPAVTQARIEWPSGCRLHAASDLPLSIFDGDDITVFARLHSSQADALCGPVRLLGQLEGEGAEVLLAELQPAFIADEANTLARLAAHQRYHQLRLVGEEVPAVLKKQLPALAEKYQLVTDDTSLVLVKEREAALKAADMPALRKVDSMLAAGWGGVGTVQACFRLSSAMSFGFEDAVVHANAVPSVWRTRQSPQSRGARTLFSKASSGRPASKKKFRAFIDSLGAPATPTKSPTKWHTPTTAGAFSEILGDGGTQTSHQCLGLTPLGVVEALRLNPRAHWPRDYKGLEGIELPPRVLEWLELLIGDGHDPKVVVKAFLEVMSGFEFTLRQSVHAAVQTLQTKRTETTDPALQALMARIRLALDGMEPDEWPPAVVDYAEASAQA